LANATRTISSAETGEIVAVGAEGPAVAAAAPLDYEDLRRTYNINPDLEVAAVRRNPVTNIGHALETEATVVGVVSKDSGRTAILQIDQLSTVVDVPPLATGADLMRAGNRLRLLLLAGQSTEGGASFTLLGATTSIVPNPGAVPQESLFRSPYGDDLKIVPPGAGAVLPSANPDWSRDRRSSSRRDTSAATNDRGQGSQSSVLLAQKPAYAALVRRFNHKLTDAEVDEIATALLRAGNESNLDPRFLAAIIAVESDFDIHCLSSSGAMGLGQLMPFNLKEAGITNAWNPTQNIMGTARLLRGHLNDYRDRPDCTLLAVAAYNAGPGAVRRAGYKVPPGQQVQRYVWKVYYRYKEFAPDAFAAR
jgi:soluble lytic murein transglycosylase-like protein